MDAAAFFAWLQGALTDSKVHARLLFASFMTSGYFVAFDRDDDGGAPTFAVAALIASGALSVWGLVARAWAWYRARGDRKKAARDAEDEKVRLRRDHAEAEERRCREDAARRAKRHRDIQTAVDKLPPESFQACVRAVKEDRRDVTLDPTIRTTEDLIKVGGVTESDLGLTGGRLLSEMLQRAYYQLTDEGIAAVTRRVEREEEESSAELQAIADAETREVEAEANRRSEIERAVPGLEDALRDRIWAQVETDLISAPYPTNVGAVVELIEIGLLIQDPRAEGRFTLHPYAKELVKRRICEETEGGTWQKHPRA